MRSKEGLTYMRKVENILLKTLAKPANGIAWISVNTASSPFLYQPKESETVRKLCKYRDESN